MPVYAWIMVTAMALPLATFWQIAKRGRYGASAPAMALFSEIRWSMQGQAICNLAWIDAHVGSNSGFGFVPFSAGRRSRDTPRNSQ